jgi:hypothetical protein
MPEQKIESGRIADGAVLGNKIAANAIRGNNIVAGTITGNLLAAQTITGDDLADNIIRGNNIVAGTITGNLLAAQTITGDDLADNSIRSNNIVAGQITGNLLGTNAVSSNTLAANLTISLSRAIEEANISAIALSGVYTIHVANNGVYMFDANTTGNVTFNLRANTQNAFDAFLTVGETASVAIGVRHGATRHEANLQIDGNAQTLFYIGNTRPSQTSISRQEYNVFSYTVFKTGANAYIVLAANTLFATG